MIENNGYLRSYLGRYYQRLVGADVPHLTEICTAIVGILVAIGIVKKPPTANESQSEQHNDSLEGQKDDNSANDKIKAEK